MEYFLKCLHVSLKDLGFDSNLYTMGNFHLQTPFFVYHRCDFIKGGNIVTPTHHHITPYIPLTGSPPSNSICHFIKTQRELIPPSSIFSLIHYINYSTHTPSYLTTNKTKGKLQISSSDGELIQYTFLVKNAAPIFMSPGNTSSI